MSNITEQKKKKNKPAKRASTRGTSDDGISITEQETARQTRTERELARLDAEQQAAPKSKPLEKKPAERSSTRGTSNDEINAGAERAMQPLRFDLRDAVLKKDTARANELRRRLLALQASKI